MIVSACKPMNQRFILIAGVSTELTHFAVLGLQLAVALPGLVAFQSWLRARLMKEESTAGIYHARRFLLLR